jgi:hypothetical protein
MFHLAVVHSLVNEFQHAGWLVGSQDVVINRDAHSSQAHARVRVVRTKRRRGEPHGTNRSGRANYRSIDLDPALETYHTDHDERQRVIG